MGGANWFFDRLFDIATREQATPDAAGDRAEADGVFGGVLGC